VRVSTGRSKHNALDALTVTLKGQKVSWILNVDITAFVDEIWHEWMLTFLGHRIADRRLLGLICKWFQAGVMEDGCRVAATQADSPMGAHHFEACCPFTHYCDSSLSSPCTRQAPSPVVRGDRDDLAHFWL